MNRIAKLGDYMPEHKGLELYGSSNETRFLVYFPIEFVGKRAEIFPDLKSGKMMISILPKNYDGGVKIHPSNRFGRPHGYCSFGKKWYNGISLQIDAKKYQYDGKKFVVDIKNHTPSLKDKDKSPASDPIPVEVAVENVIQKNDSPKKIAIACVRQLNKFADDYNYTFEVHNGKLSMVSNERIE